MQAGAVRRIGMTAVAVVAIAATGCASLLGSYDIAPSGLASSEDRLRRMLVTQQAGTAFERLQKDAPDDELLHALYHGVLAYHAGSYAESARALDIAAHIADERMTLSLSRAALSMVTSDLALHYTPGRTERLMIPWYAALARMRMGDVDGAAVEARRLSMLLQRYEDEGAKLDAGLRATLRYVAGAIFERAGEPGDADVAYRNAVALDPSLKPYRGERGTGTVLVLLEQGFVSHRVEQGLAVMLLPEEVNAIAHGGADDKALASAFVAGRVVEYATRMHSTSTLHVPAPDRALLPASLRRTVTCATSAPPADSAAAAVPVTQGTGGTTAVTGTAPPEAAGAARAVRTAAGQGTSQQCSEQERRVDQAPYLLRVAWPAYRAQYRPQPALLLAGTDTAGFGRGLDISAGVVADFEKERMALLARTVARSTAKLALTKGAERRLEEQNEVAGRLLGILGNVSSALLERADTRSWHLLPAGVSLVRMELPAGEHHLSVEVGGRQLSLGVVDVRPGSVNLLPARAW
jgi:tetratricopeptide (TPR) repeat protein